MTATQKICIWKEGGGGKSSMGLQKSDAPISRPADMLVGNNSENKILVQ